MLTAYLQAALAVCLHDDTRGVGGLLHLRYVATDGERPLDLTDNTLSCNLLLMERFCKELRAAGARKHSWRVSILGHVPHTPGLHEPAATVIDLAKAYFSDARLPLECREFRCAEQLAVRLHAREGHIWVSDAPDTGL